MEKIGSIPNIPADSSKHVKVPGKVSSEKHTDPIQDPVDIGVESNKPPEKEVTFLFYMNGQYGDLQQPIAASMLGLENTGSDENVNVVAQLGRTSQENSRPGEGLDRIDNDWSGVRRYYVVKSDEPRSDTISLESMKMLQKEIPDNPLVHFTVADIHSQRGEEHIAAEYYSKARELGYEKFLNEPGSADVSRWSIEFDEALQPLRDEQAEKNVYVSPVAQDLGDKSMMHPNSLKDFVSWGMSRYPAKYYCLVMMGHGSAWNGTNKMNPSEIGMAVQAGTFEANQQNDRNDKVGVMVFNSCYMGNLETMHEVRNAADYTVASQMAARINIFYHWPEIIKNVQDQIKNNQEFSPKQLAMDMVRFYEEKNMEDASLIPMIRHSKESYLTLTALDNKKIEKVTQSWGKLVKNWKISGRPMHDLFKVFKDSKNYRSNAYSPDQMFDYGTLKDLGSIAVNITNDPGVPHNLKEDCRELRDSIREAVIAEQHLGHDMDGSSGLTIWAPTGAADIAMMKDKYREFVPSFVDQTGWDDELDASTKAIDGKVLAAFMYTIGEMAKVSKLSEVSDLSSKDIQRMNQKMDILELEARQLQKELDLSNPDNYSKDIQSLLQNSRIAASLNADEMGLKETEKGSLMSFELNAPFPANKLLFGDQ